MLSAKVPSLRLSQGALELHVHEASTSSDHDILDIRERFELGAADEHWSILPHAIILEEAGAIAMAIGTYKPPMLAAGSISRIQPRSTYRLLTGRAS
jgi:hypothetical protein